MPPILQPDQFKMRVFELVVWNLYDSQLTDALGLIEIEIMQRRGYKDGRAAGSWVFDGNTTEETIKRIRRGIEDGDPEILDSLPSPRLGGEFADDPDWEDVMREEGIRFDSEMDADGRSDLMSEYEMKFQDGVQDEIMEYGRHSVKVEP